MLDGWTQIITQMYQLDGLIGYSLDFMYLVNITRSQVICILFSWRILGNLYSGK